MGNFKLYTSFNTLLLIIHLIIFSFDNAGFSMFDGDYLHPTIVDGRFQYYIENKDSGFEFIVFDVFRQTQK